MRAKILEYQTEIMLAQGITDERIVGNIAEIAFDKANNNVDRNRALETLCRQRGMLVDKFQDTTTDRPALTPAQQERYKLLAKAMTKRDSA